MINQLDDNYIKILNNILDHGHLKSDRTGTGTKSVFGENIRHNMVDGFPLLTTKKVAWKTMVIELLWFLKGGTNIKYLVDNGCNIWNGDCYKQYKTEFEKGNASGLSNLSKRLGVDNENVIIPKEDFILMIKDAEELGVEDFAEKWGELGPIYGKQWRAWGGYIKPKKYGFINKIDGDWLMKWSDLHSFGSGTSWCYTPIKHSSELTESDIDKKVVFNFEGDLTQFNPTAYAIIDSNPKKKYVNHIDQISDVINLLKTNPDSRRMLVSAWNPSDLNSMVLPPCHYSFQMYTRELTLEERWDWLKCNTKSGIPWDRMGLPPHDWLDNVSLMKVYDPKTFELLQDKGTVMVPKRAISLKWIQRSVDSFLGLPFNIGSYGLLLQIFAQHVNMVPETLIGSLGDTHLYLNHLDQAKEQIGRILTLDERLLMVSDEKRELFKNGKVDTPDSSDDEKMLLLDDLNIPRRTREPYKLPKVKIKPFKTLEELTFDHFELIGYQSHPRINAPLSN